MNTETNRVPQNSEALLSRRCFLDLTLSGAAALAAGGTLLSQAGRAFPAESGKKVRMAVVGGGFGATFHWHEHPNCVVTAVTDLYPQRRDALRNHYRCDNVYDSLEILLQKEKNVDAVAVFSGAVDHAKHVKMCMERGLHVVSAVPACTSLEDAAMLKELKEKTGLRYMMAESSYYRPECIFARNLHQTGAFGELFYSEVEYYHDIRDEAQPGRLGYHPDGTRSWRWGFPPMWYPTHSLGYLVGVTRERITKVSCLGWGGTAPEIREHPFRRENPYNNPFFCSASIMQTSGGHPCRCNEFRWCVPYGERAQWFGDQATLYMAVAGVHGDVLNKRGPGAQPAQIPNYWQSDMLPEPMRHVSGHGGSAVFVSAEFVNALVEDREPAIDIYESLAMTVPGLVAHQSALQEGEQMKVPSFDRA
jgi:predicted dehydrogenase